ncbi:MAG: hypothetical protein ACXV5H_07295 [Halobacteriota archaeon]
MVEETSKQDETTTEGKEGTDAEGEGEQTSSGVRYFVLFIVSAFLIMMGLIFIVSMICAGNLEAMAFRANYKLREMLS